MPFALPCQRVGKGIADRPVLVANQEVDMGYFVSFTCQRFADEHGHPISLP
jgi:hypothetical protein